ncbi:MAG: hypothetical protein AAFQ82_19840, partial [Myxococcota bacterium]
GRHPACIIHRMLTPLIVIEGAVFDTVAFNGRAGGRAGTRWQFGVALYRSGEYPLGDSAQSTGR